MTAFPAVLLIIVFAATQGKRDADLQQDTWTVAAAVFNGQAFGLIKGDSLTIKGQNFTAQSKEGESKGTLKFGTDKRPYTIDFVHIEGPAKGKTLLAIYELTDDELKICSKGVGKERPSEMTGKSGTGNLLITLKREKK
jgi:uncharacterized protein (TIGR03067 family)